MASLMPQGKQRYTDNNGNNLSGGKLFAYSAGTSTPLDTYSDQAGTIPNTNPVILNARGEATIFWGASPYKVVLKDASDVEIWTQDNLHASASVADLASTAAGKGASLIGYIPSGVGAVARTVQSKLSDFFTTSDYTSLAQAKTAAGNSPVYDPLGIIHKDTFNHISNPFVESGGSGWKSAHIFRSADNAGAHTGNAYSAQQLEYRPVGSGTNGPTHADYGLTVSLVKKSFDTTSVVGEIDGLNIVVRQGGAGSDATCWLGNVAHYGTGFTAVFEAQSSIIAASVVTRQVQIQGGVTDNVNGIYVGFFANANTGALTDAYRCDNTAGSSWTNFFRGIKDGVERCRISSDGDIFLSGSTGVKKQIGVSSGSFRIVNDAGTQELINITDAGLVTTFGAVSAPSFSVLGTQVVSSRNTGWSAFTGTSNKATVYDTSTITLNQLAERVNSLQVALTTHGLIGA